MARGPGRRLLGPYRRRVWAAAGALVLAASLAWWLRTPPAPARLSDAVVGAAERESAAGAPVLVLDAAVAPVNAPDFVGRVNAEAAALLGAVLEHWPERYAGVVLRVVAPGGASPPEGPPLLRLRFETAVLRRLDLERLPGALLNFAAPEAGDAARRAIAAHCEAPGAAEAYRSFCIRALR